VEFRKSVKVRSEIGSDPEKGDPLQVRWNRSIRNWLNASISKSMDFSQENKEFYRY
jgi:hypothetical protein